MIDELTLAGIVAWIVTSGGAGIILSRLTTYLNLLGNLDSRVKRVVIFVVSMLLGFAPAILEALPANVVETMNNLLPYIAAGLVAFYTTQETYFTDKKNGKIE